MANWLRWLMPTKKKEYTPVKQIQSINDLHLFVNQDKTTLIKCEAEWCNSCRSIRPMIESLNDKFNGQIAVVDVDNVPAITELYGVTSLPTLLIFKDGFFKENIHTGYTFDSLSKILKK